MKVFSIVIFALILCLELSHGQTDDGNGDRLTTTEFGTAPLGTESVATDNSNIADNSNFADNSNVADNSNFADNSNIADNSNFADNSNNAATLNSVASPNNGGNSDAICEACSSFDDPTSITPKSDPNVSNRFFCASCHEV